MCLMGDILFVRILQKGITMSEDIKYKVVARLGVIDTYTTGWRKEINLISWNGQPAKYDIRDWDSSHELMSRGVTLYEDEMKTMMQLVSKFHDEHSERATITPKKRKAK